MAQAIAAKNAAKRDSAEGVIIIFLSVIIMRDKERWGQLPEQR
jgi:hypothetical protein